MIYIISFDPHKSNAEGLHKIIAESQYIQNWWHYLGSTYLIKSRNNINTLKNEVLINWPRQRFLITKIDSSEFSGYLPAEAWKWIRENS